ncbi:MAG TPA: tetratricopeptide repeat protein [Pyrinomonadaceae bacterium]|nr:tetratricopeptide repeat protein [Pyrinomonadaceae bacterium]
MKRLTLPLALLLFIVAVSPSIASAKDTWISVRSKNFSLVGNASEKQIKQVSARLEQFREMYGNMFPRAVMNTPVPTTVIVFKNDSSYRPFKPNESTAGYFQSGDDVNYITLTAEKRGQQDPFTVIFHEYTHLLVNNTLGNIPTWFSEGLAEYYSTVDISDDQKVTLGTPIGSHVYLLREKKMLPLRTLFQVDQKSPYYNEREKQSIFYAESWALVHYLILGNGGARSKQVGAFVDAMNRNVPMEEAFQQSFSMTFENMEKELKDYIKNDRYPVMNGHFERKLGADLEMQVAPLSEAQAQAYLGDLLLHSNRVDAETYLQKALSLDPDLAMAHASMGMLRVKQGRADEARQSLERAVASDSQNYLTHYYYAYALSRSGQDSTGLVSSFPQEHIGKMRASLEKAIALRPDFVGSVSLLAFINLVTETKIDETIDMLIKTRSRAKGRNDLMFMQAQLHLQKRDIKAAKELIGQMSASNSDDELMFRAQSLLRQIEAMENVPALRNGGRFDSADRTVVVVDEAEAGSVDPSSYLRAALRKPHDGEVQAQGILEKVDCDARGMTFVIRVADSVIRLRAGSFEDVDMTSFTPDAGREITCGPRKPESNVVVNYTTSSDARSKATGVAKSLEFVPQDFKLKP